MAMNLIVEAELRVYACGLMVEAVQELELPHVVAVTCQLLFHKYMSSCVELIDSRNVVVPAMGAFSLATKVEESPKMPREIIFAFFDILRRRKQLPQSNLDVGSPKYRTFKIALVMEEKHILRAIGFKLNAFLDAHNPQRYALYVVKVLGGSAELAQATWNFLNDSSRMDIALRHKPRAVVAAAIFLAARTLQVPLALEPHPWWVILVSEEDEMLDVANDILAVYKITRHEWVEPVPAKFQNTEHRTFSTSWITV
jgi:hypothetical protein